MKWDKLSADFRCPGRATDAEIERFEKDAGFKLPPDYAEFLMWSNGGAGFVGKSAFLRLWQLNDLLDTNVAYAITQFAPEFFAFGSDGGGEAFAFDRRNSEMQIVCVPFIGMEADTAIFMAPTFTDFIEVLYREGFPHRSFLQKRSSD